MWRSLMAFMLLSPIFISVHADEIATPYHKSVTLSPFHLLNPELHVTGELRLARKMSVSATLGAGRITDEGRTCNIREAGGQFRYYLLGSFAHGMMLGADAGYVDMDAKIENPIAYLVGVRAGGFIGYKYSTKIGFAAEIQIGPIYLWGESADTSELQTLFNLKIGWSF
jgi:hypothetical protein